MPELTIRPATPEDLGLIRKLIAELALYEKLENEVVVTESLLHEYLFVQSIARCVLAYEADEPVGFALWFYNYSTFIGKKGLYLEDLFVRPAFRQKGYGKKLLLHLVSIAVAEDCGRMEWSVLNWNTPAIDFYNSLGAVPMEEWTLYRLSSQTMRKLCS
ncbi:MAG: GNAT family N-acetyltransferase [Chitinophagaceae bacterium]|nr:GNAT family N-acetyltransferase [Chitinophagaceae bacterium]